MCRDTESFYRSYHIHTERAEVKSDCRCKRVQYSQEELVLRSSVNDSAYVPRSKIGRVFNVHV